MNWSHSDLLQKSIFIVLNSSVFHSNQATESPLVCLALALLFPCSLGACGGSHWSVLALESVRHFGESTNAEGFPSVPIPRTKKMTTEHSATCPGEDLPTFRFPPAPISHPNWDISEIIGSLGISIHAGLMSNISRRSKSFARTQVP